MAAPVRGYGGLVLAAVAVAGPAARLADTRGSIRARYRDLVVECAQSISSELALPR